jgi:acyl-CoA thioesterase II
MSSCPEFDELLTLLELEAAGPDRFVGRSPAGRTRSIFGGQFAAQALMAAGRTVPDGRAPHSLHAYFLRAGDPRRPIEYRTEVVRDGRTYHHRQVVAAQDGKEVFRLLAGFTAAGSGPYHQPPGGSVPVPRPAGAGGGHHPDGTVGADPDRPPVPPDRFLDGGGREHGDGAWCDYVSWTMAGTDNTDHPWAGETTPLDVVLADPPDPAHGRPVPTPLRMWIRLRGTVPSEDPLLHAALLAWVSDKTLADLAILVHGRRWVDDGVTSVSLDHTMWFLEPARADGWLRFDQQVDHTAGGRGLVRGALCTADGRQVAIAAQEAIVGLPDAP